MTGTDPFAPTHWRLVPGRTAVVVIEPDRPGTDHKNAGSNMG